MIPVGYMAKRVVKKPDWLKADNVVDIYSVSNCMSDDFTDFTTHWKTNGYWFLDSLTIIDKIAKDNAIDMEGTKLFYYEVYELEYDENSKEWRPFQPSFPSEREVVEPEKKFIEGYDIVTFSVNTSPECSPLSCNNLATEIPTNKRCLLESLEEAKCLLESERFNDSEPGPYRIFAVYSV
jgi:hypothetical protein